MADSPNLHLPVVPLRNAVLFPGVNFPISAGRPQTLREIESAMKDPEHLVIAVSQREDIEALTPEGLHTIGTIASIGALQRGVGGARLILQGQKRGIAIRISEKDGIYQAIVHQAAE